ncbi:unnamed protein product [Linum trigynum]|uniref:Ubiquitin-like domain-containing protein n=1 Tax=Linum trigynum TaxID=586398 RepID=A0AAV2FWY3_9ROSI
MEDHRTVASYGIRAGETALLDLQIEPIGVMVHFVGTPNSSYPIEYDERVATVKRLIVAQLKKTGVEDIGPEDMELRLGDVKLDNPRAALRDYGVENASVILVSTAKEIFLPRRPTASAL